jgi:hypothetical protein
VRLLTKVRLNEPTAALCGDKSKMFSQIVDNLSKTLPQQRFFGREE